MLIVNASETRRLLPMAECIDVMERAMRSASSGTVGAPVRLIAPLPDGAGYFFLMPGSLQEPAVYGAKIISLLPGNPAAGRPAVQGFVTLFDGDTGAPAALIDGGEITRIRTSAASALATRVLAREDASSHGILGAGAQAAGHLEAVARVRGIRRVKLWARDFGKARQFALERSRDTGLPVEAVDQPEQAAACDIVSVVTNSPRPVLLGKWLQPGAHVNLVGAHEPQHREADTDAVAQSAVYVDSRPGALREAGDLLIPIGEGRIAAGHIRGEIGEVLSGAASGRQHPREITLYKSLGIVAQDLYAAAHVLQAARRLGRGERVAFP